MLNSALRYLKMGLSVIPLEPLGKKPLIKWEEFQKRLATEQEVRDWFGVAPNANIGIVTGPLSNLAVIDLDGPEGLASAIRLGLESTVISITGRGKHLWFRYAQGLVNSASKIAQGIDVRGEGGFVVAPPSVHETGLRYRWGGNAMTMENLLLFPTGLLNALAATEVTSYNDNKSESWVSEALEEIKNGHTHNTLVRVLGKFRAHNFSVEDTRLLLSPSTSAAGMADEELQAKISEIWGRYEPNRTSIGDAGERSIKDSSRLYANTGGLIIHSPQRSDSLEQFELHKRAVTSNAIGSLQTGYPKLDSFLVGGLKSSRLLTIAARTGVGKTNWLLGVTRNVCRSGKRVLLFSTEMPYQEIWKRYIDSLANPEEFKSHQFYVCDSFAPNIEKVEEAIKEVKPDVFMFDHINHVSEEQRELGAFMQGLNYLRRKYDVAGIVAAQLNRSADWVDLKTGEKVTPRMSMIKGSGTIEQASSRVLLLSEKRVLPEYTEIIGNLDKNDNGEKGLLHFGLFKNPWQIKEL